MSKKERLRKSVVDQVASGVVTQAEAAFMLGLSTRQMKRIMTRFRTEGDAGLVHRSRGRHSSRAYDAKFREEALARYTQEYEGLGPTLAAEKLAEDGFAVDHETLRRWLLREGKWQRRRKRQQHRARRPPKEHFGELIQLDGSHHHWFGQEQPRCCLMSLVDDATGRAMTLMMQEETTEAAMTLLQRWIERYGIPKALYTDRKSVYVTERPPTLKEQLAGQEPLTAFGLSCSKLGIKIIIARSPQAKGRVERKHGVYQDRLCHELRLRKISTLEAANRLLEEEFDEQLNQKFARVARSSHNFHRPVPKETDLRDVFCLEETRVLSNDWTISYYNRIFQIAKLNSPLPKPKSKITVRIWRDASIHVLNGEQRLVFTTLDEKPKRAQPVKAPKTPRPKPKPAQEHPWRKKALARSEAL
jgi:transposase